MAMGVSAESLVEVIGWDGQEKLMDNKCVVLLNYQINDSVGRDLFKEMTVLGAIVRFLMVKGGRVKISESYQKRLS